MFKVGDKVKLLPYNIKYQNWSSDLVLNFIGLSRLLIVKVDFFEAINTVLTIKEISSNIAECYTKDNTVFFIPIDVIEKINPLVYYYGDPKRGEEILKALEALGGTKNPNWTMDYDPYYDGSDPNRIYCIFPDNTIRGAACKGASVTDFIKKFYTEAKLPELSKETITIKGKTYYTDEVEERLKSLKEITK